MNIYNVFPSYYLGRNAYRYTIVVAKDEDSAKLIHPSGNNFFEGSLWYKVSMLIDDWVNPYYLEAELLGTTDKFSEGTILCSVFGEKGR
jgi:hypothetical protein|nr:MAG TPA: hypothetical protein [Caudoviricetes sp.]